MVDERRQAGGGAQGTGVEPLRWTDARFREFLEHLPGLAWVKDGAGRYVYANRAALEAFGRTLEELVGRFDEEIFPRETAALFRANDLRAIESGTVLRTIERLEHGNGTMHHAMVSKFPLRGGGEAGGVMVGGIAIDITELKETEHVLRASEARFREADARKDEFLAMLSHELRNPLAPIRNALEILRWAGAARAAAGVAPPPEKIAAAIEMMDRQVGQMVRLLDDLLDVSRISRGRIALRKERTALAAVVRQAVDGARGLCAELGQELVVRLPGTPVVLDADPARLAQVLGNLLSNASKFTDRGGRIELEVERLAGEPPAVELRVRDTGIGIPAEELPRVFELFAQVDRSLDRSEGGLGIGLALVRRLVEMHGGEVEARSAGPGAGSEFVVRLPVAGEAAPPLPVAPAATPALQPLRVLIVDDNRDAATALAILLGLAGHATRTVFDGGEAVEEARRLSPDAVLLDIGLPGLDGYEVARRLRAEPRGGELALVAITGWGQDADRRRSAEVGFDAHLVKPVDGAALLRLLAGLVAKRRDGTA
jgi:PAS domain S-box-containing protein